MHGSPSSNENRTYLDLRNFQARIKFLPSEEFSNGDSYFVLQKRINDNECL